MTRSCDSLNQISWWPCDETKRQVVRSRGWSLNVCIPHLGGGIFFFFSPGFSSNFGGGPWTRWPMVHTEQISESLAHLTF